MEPRTWQCTVGCLLYGINPHGIAAAKNPLCIQEWGSITGAVWGRGHAGCRRPAARSLAAGKIQQLDFPGKLVTMAGHWEQTDIYHVHKTRWIRLGAEC